MGLREIEAEIAWRHDPGLTQHGAPTISASDLMFVRSIQFVIEAIPVSAGDSSDARGSLDAKLLSCKAFGCPSHMPDATGEA